MNRMLGLKEFKSHVLGMLHVVSMDPGTLIFFMAPGEIVSRELSFVSPPSQNQRMTKAQTN